VSDQLSWPRLAALLRNDFLRVHRSVLLILGTVAVLALVVSAASAADGVVGAGFYSGLFIATLFAWGTVATSLSFTDLHGRGTNTAFLMLPASALEKTVSRLLLCTVGVIVSVFLLTTVLSWLLEGINALLFDVRREVYSPFDALSWLLVPHYLVAQGLFFLGATWFRKTHYVKTVGAVTALAIGLCAVAVGIAWLLGAANWGGGNMRIDGDFDGSIYRPLEWLADAARAIYFFVLPPFCWFVAWLRVTETQVSHGI